MRWSQGFLAVATCLFTPAIFAAECAKPPVRDSEQATCYAVAYAERHRLAHGSAFNRSAAKGQKVWTVRFLNDRPGARARGWEVDIDAASARVVRFTSYRAVGPSKD